MKKICLVRDERPYWETIEQYLSEVNAETLILGDNPGSDQILDCHPDLIVANAWAHRSMSSRVRQKPIIVIKEGTPPVAMMRETDSRNLLITGWPLKKDRFLDITSRMLSVAPRRSFRTLIRVFPEGEQLGFLGQSQNFSLTGMAFTSEADLPASGCLTVSFSVPASTRSVRMEAEIVRRIPGHEDSRILYGVRFRSLGAEQRAILSSFILGA